MKALLLIFLIPFVATSFADEYVQGYTKKDGTQVDGYYRSEKNDTKADNYSTKGNVNPHTGQKGTKDPYDN